MPLPPGGTLSDYIPFYFTPRSPMLMNIKTGFHGIQQRRNDEIMILVASLRDMLSMQIQFVFTDRHAYLRTAEFYSDLKKLELIDWTILRRSDFKHANDNPVKVERYQAEALIFRHVPVAALRGIACSSEAVVSKLQGQIAAAGVDMKVAARPGWYF